MYGIFNVINYKYYQLVFVLHNVYYCFDISFINNFSVMKQVILMLFLSQ